MTPETREFLNFCSIALKVQPVERGVYHRGFIAHTTNTPLREMSTQTFCAIIRAIRKAKPAKVYVDSFHNVRSGYDVRNNLWVALFDGTTVKYKHRLSYAMVQQIDMRQKASDFRWIRRTKKGHQIITKYGVSND